MRQTRRRLHYDSVNRNSPSMTAATTLSVRRPSSVIRPTYRLSMTTCCGRWFCDLTSDHGVQALSMFGS
jgi:hypothetical protein